MTSLAEAYEEPRRARRRLYLGSLLFIVGAVLSVLGIALFSTGLGRELGLDVYRAREAAGVAAGLGVPAVFVGVFTVLPANRRERAAAAAGAVVSVLGVILFSYAYPERWVASGPGHLTLPVVVVYFLGAITAFWALFAAVVNFKRRNNPGGTVTLTRTVDGETRRVEVPVSELEGRDVSGIGGIGVVGAIDREAVDREDGDDGAVVETGGASAPASDGGTETETLETPGTGTHGPATGAADRYCGNCAHFDYVRTDGGMQPYCGFHDELMDDMNPCERWEPNAPRSRSP